MVSTKLLTAEDLERLPDDGNRYELVLGELIRMRPTGFRHAELAHLFSHALISYVRPRGLGVVGGEGGFVLHREPDTVRAPDVFFVSAERAPRGEAARHFAELAPDLTIEIKSPSDSMAVLLAKADEYLAAGTRLTWTVDPDDRAVIVKTPDGRVRILGYEDTLDGEDVIPGFRLPLRDIFGDDD
jgi:Uma2 family endonuclease